MTDLETLANLAEVFGALTIIGGLLFAVIQVRQYRQQLRETATLELMNRFQTPEFAQAFRTLRSLRDDVPSSELNADNPETEAAAMFVCSVYETVGVLVFRRILPFQVVEDLTGGAIFFFKDEDLYIDIKYDTGTMKFKKERIAGGNGR